MKKYLTPISLLLLMFVGLWLVVREQKTNYSHSRIHKYDYIIEVEATSNIEHIYIFDDKHNSVGDFYSNHPDSLQIIIDADNL